MINMSVSFVSEEELRNDNNNFKRFLRLIKDFLLSRNNCCED